MTRRLNIIASVAVLAISGLCTQPAMAETKGMSFGIGSAPRASKPQAQSNYSVPNYSGGNYAVNNRPNQSPYNYGGFAQPSIVYQPSFVAPNYYLPGDYYARSTYYVPIYASPVVIYPAPLSRGGFLFSPSPRGGGPNRYSLTYGPLNR